MTPHVPKSDRGLDLTPLVDVMLTLLILFFVIQPALRRGLDLQVPKEAESAAEEDPKDQLVLHVSSGPAYELNGTLLPADRLQAELERIFRHRGRKVLFVEAEEALPFAAVIGAVDAARGAGIEVVGLVPRGP